MKAVVASIISAAALSGCASPKAEPATAFCLADVKSFSNPEAGARGDFSPNVKFGSFDTTPYTIGYGAAGNRSDEITIMDGKLHLARPNGSEGFEERKSYDKGEGAYMLQLVAPQRWSDTRVLPALSSLDEIGASVSDAAHRSGCIGDAKLAYKIRVHVVEAEWSLDTLPTRGTFTTRDQDAWIVGLYATIDQQRHFVPARNIHAHIVFPALGVAGHLNAVRISDGGALLLQAK